MNGPGVRAFRGPRRSPIPSALLVDKHFEQWVTRGEGAKFSPTYTPEMQEGIRNTPKLFVFFVQNVMPTFVSIFVLKSGSPVQT